MGECGFMTKILMKIQAVATPQTIQGQQTPQLQQARFTLC
jgi:hypothetical protein